MQEFSAEGGPQMLGGPIFRGEERKFTSGESLAIWGNFYKICIKSIKLGKFIEKIVEKFKILGKFFNFLAKQNVLIREKQEK